MASDTQAASEGAIPPWAFVCACPASPSSNLLEVKQWMLLFQLAGVKLAQAKGLSKEKGASLSGILSEGLCMYPAYSRTNT